MKINKRVLQMLDCNKGIATIMLALDCSYSAARTYVKEGKDDLTKFAAIEAIKTFTGLETDQIIEKAEEATAQ